MLETYTKQFAKLRTDKVAGRWSEATNNQAPHKPLLLLSVIDLFAQGKLQNNLIEPNIELGELFNDYWTIVMPEDSHMNIALPFYHLRSAGF